MFSFYFLAVNISGKCCAFGNSRGLAMLTERVGCTSTVSPRVYKFWVLGCTNPLQSSSYLSAVPCRSGLVHSAIYNHRYSFGRFEDSRWRKSFKICRYRFFFNLLTVLSYTSTIQHRVDLFIQKHLLLLLLIYLFNRKYLRQNRCAQALRIISPVCNF